MSYLLTEIALEMLGYKFYDINGKQGATNFQSNGQPNYNNNTGESFENEESLENILNNTNTASSPTIGSSPESCEISYNNVTLIEKPIIEGISIVTEHKSDKTSADDGQQLKQKNSRRHLSSTLTRLFDREYEKIRRQIVRNKDIFIQSNTELIKRIDQRENAAINETLTPFNKQELSNLQRELQTMQAFRKKIERTLFKVNSKNYEKYKRTFADQSQTE